MLWNRAVLLVALTAAVPGIAGVPPIPSLPEELVTVNEDYRVRLDPDPISVCQGFCLSNPHYFPLTKGVEAALALDRDGIAGPGNPRGYHAGYVNLGFRDPFFSELPKTNYFYDCKGNEGDALSCDNGFAQVSKILMPTSVYADKSDPCIRAVLGHELFHHVEFAYADAIGEAGCGGIWGTTACEGQARALQDKIYLDLDLDPALSCVAGFQSQANSYLKDTNQYLWSSSYDGALFWTYLMEQFGTIGTEPNRGADFLVQWWNNAEAAGAAGADAFAITEATIKDFAPTRSVAGAFFDFTLANLVKDFDLSNVSDGFLQRYSYRDEDPVFIHNKGNFNDVDIDFELDVAQDAPTTQLLGVQYYGARYLRADVSECPANRILSVEFDAADTTPQGLANFAGYGVVVVRNNRPIEFYKKVDVDWMLTTFQVTNAYDDIYISVAPLVGFWIGNITVSCDPPETTLDVDFPLMGPLRPTHGGAPGDLSIVEVDVQSSVTGDRIRLVRGLEPSVFRMAVGDEPATILGGIPTFDGNRLQVQLPAQPAEGDYDFIAEMADASATATAAVVHGEHFPDVVIALDTSISMTEPSSGSRLDALRRAGQYLVDNLPEAGQLGLIRYSGDDVEPNDDAEIIVPLGPADETLRNRVKSGIDNLGSGVRQFTSIGDGLLAAIDQLARTGAADQEHHVVLVSDGAENEGAFWTDIRDDVMNSGARVHTVALGPWADQGLLAEIARVTGGQYSYADVDVDAADRLDLFAAMQQIAAAIGYRHHVMAQRVDIEPGQTLTIEQIVPEAAIAIPNLLEARKSGNESLMTEWLRVFRPDGSEVEDGVDGAEVRFAGDYYTINVNHLQPGVWRFELAWPATSAPATIELGVNSRFIGRHLMASAGNLRFSDGSVSFSEPIRSGDLMAIFASVVDENGPIAGARMFAEVEDPDGATRRMALDGTSNTVLLSENLSTNGDGAVDASDYVVWRDGLGSHYLFGSPTAIPDDPLLSGLRRGSYQFKVMAEFSDGTRQFVYPTVYVREPLGGAPDRDGDGLPDRFEERLACLDPDSDDATLDPDEDDVPSLFEFREGTNPCDPDSDGGGENDGSERRGGRGPLDAGDDALPRPVEAYVVTRLSEHEPDLALEPDTIAIKTPGSRKFANIVLKRGVTDTDLSDHAVLGSEEIGRIFIDRTDITSGQEYFYQVIGFDAAGNESAPSHVFSGVARSDVKAPRGAVEINGGAPRTDDDSLALEISLYDEDPSTTMMCVEVTGGPPCVSEPYVKTLNVDVARPVPVPYPQVSVVFTDAAGNESIPYTDEIRMLEPDSLGDIRGRVILTPESIGAGEEESGTLIEIMNHPGEKPALTDSEGFWRLADLNPGTYTLRFSRFEHAIETIGQVQVTAGRVTELPDVTLLPLSVFIFVDRFED